MIRDARTEKQEERDGSVCGCGGGQGRPAEEIARAFQFDLSGIWGRITKMISWFQEENWRLLLLFGIGLIVALIISALEVSRTAQ